MAIQGSELKRSLAPSTALLLGLGVAIGSGILRTPGLVAAELGSAWWVLLLWALGGAFILASSLVSAELSTRFPKAGGEYVYLREAYGPFMAFFFGWGYTIFIVGGGAATIAAATGEAAATLLGLPDSLSGPLGALAVVLVTLVNLAGLKSGALAVNALTLLKVFALIVLVGAAFVVAEHSPEFSWSLQLKEERNLLTAMIAAFPAVLWAYEGTTDAVKMAEEIEDVQRSLPRALIASALLLTGLYLLVNLAYLWVLSPQALAGAKMPALAIFEGVFGTWGATAMALVSLVIFLGALSSTILATVRVSFALARDGLSFRFMAKMSEGQAPTGALLVVGSIAVFFCLFRDFGQILNIYFLASAVLFGLSYGSLIVFRLRERGQEVSGRYFKAPMGIVLSLLLILTQLAMAALIVVDSPKDALGTILLLGAIASFYLIWRRFYPQESSH